MIYEVKEQNRYGKLRRLDLYSLRHRLNVNSNMPKNLPNNSYVCYKHRSIYDVTAVYIQTDPQNLWVKPWISQVSRGPYCKNRGRTPVQVIFMAWIANTYIKAAFIVNSADEY